MHFITWEINHNSYSKDKALYKACGEEVDGKVCNKKVVENGDGTYRCEKCARDKATFKWRIMLQINMADATDNTWASCFQVLMTYGVWED